MPIWFRSFLVYKGDVVDEIRTLYPHENKCLDMILIMIAPLMLITKRMRKKGNS